MNNKVTPINFKSLRVVEPSREEYLSHAATYINELRDHFEDMIADDPELLRLLVDQCLDIIEGPNFKDKKYYVIEDLRRRVEDTAIEFWQCEQEGL